MAATRFHLALAQVCKYAVWVLFSYPGQALCRGNRSPGKAHGDGILRQPVQFELVPSIRAFPSFAQIFYIPSESVEGAFRIDDVYMDPFSPYVTPLPMPGGYPPISFDVSFGLGPSLSTEFPPLLSPPLPGQPNLWTDGTIVDTPIVANVTEAYILLEGPGIVPEPATVAMAAVAALIVAFAIVRLRRPSHDGELMRSDSNN